eukprot:scaffold12569_cov181-Isochrysis_galbana.AAC.2
MHHHRGPPRSSIALSETIAQEAEQEQDASKTMGAKEWRRRIADATTLQHLHLGSGEEASSASSSPTIWTEVVHTVQSPPLQAGSCQVCRTMKGEGDRGQDGPYGPT